LKNSGRCETNNAGYNHTKNYAKSVLTLWGPLQLLTDFNMVKIFSDESNVSYIEIKNTEIIQAKNVLVQILFDSEVKISYINCLEGKISHNKVIMIFGIILAVLLPILYVSSA